VQLARAPMCGESARIRFSRLLGGGSSRARGPRGDLLGVGDASSGCGRSSARAAPPRAARGELAARAETAPRRPPASIGNASCAAIGPASSSARAR
jgi:hypothetical protein